MIIFKTGNLLDSECQTLVNTVNCVGVMGKGIALQFKKKFPEMFEEYRLACKRGNIKYGGDIWVWNYIDMFKQRKVLCFATKQSWQYPSKLEWIEKGLYLFTHQWEDGKYTYEKLGITSIAWPKLGCTNGKLDWERQVKPLMFKYLQPLPIICEIYE